LPFIPPTDFNIVFWLIYIFSIVLDKNNIRGEYQMFLFYPKPYQDESLAGYLYRFADENFMDQLTWILINYRETYGSSIRNDDLNWLTQSHINNLEGLLKLPSGKVYDMIYNGFSTKFHIPLGNELKSSWFMHHTTKVCPLCLRDKKYHRIYWSLTHLTSCPDHSVLLIDTCKYCGRKFRPRDVVLCKCKCGKYIDTADNIIPITDTTITQHQETIMSVFHGPFIQINDWITNPQLYFEAIEKLASWIAILIPPESIRPIQEISIQTEINTRYRLKRTKSWDEALVVYTHAHKILSNWPLGYYDFLNYIEKSSSVSKAKSFATRILQKLISTPFEPFYREFNTYISRQLLNNETDKLISLTEAKSITNLSSNILLSDSSLFKTFEYIFNKNILQLVSLNDVDVWQATYNEGYTQEDLCEKWGFGKKVIQTLIKENFFKEIYKKTKGGLSIWMISRKSIEDITDLIQVNSRSIDVSNKELCSFSQLVHLMGLEITGHVFNWILYGKVDYFANGDKISELLFNKRQITLKIKEYYINLAKGSGWISSKHLSIILGVKPKDIEYWIRTGRFGEGPVDENNGIPFNSYNFFTDNYVTTQQIVEITGLSSKTILKKHQIGKIKAIAGPKLNDGKRLLFNKDVYVDFQ
jgi:TniQ